MTDVLTRAVREQAEEAKRQDRLREVANGVALALQMMPVGQIVEVLGNFEIEQLARPDDEQPGLVTLMYRVVGSPVAHRVRIQGQALDQLHELLHSDPPTAQEPEPAEAAAP